MKDLERWISGTGQKLWVHNRKRCEGEFCPIHNPSDHNMRDFPTHWRGDRGIMERICDHGVGHPDPDDYNVIHNDVNAIHGCCGCCCKELTIGFCGDTGFTEKCIGCTPECDFSEPPLKPTPPPPRIIKEDVDIYAIWNKIRSYFGYK